MRTFLSALLIGSSLFATQTLAHDYTVGDLHIGHPWSRALPPVAPTGAAYLTIENRGQQSDRLIAASTPIAGHTELHEHVHEDGLMKMQKIDRVEIAPGESVEFSPGGHHVMLFDLKEPLSDGHRYPLTLTFEQAGEVEVEVYVSKDTEADDQSPAHDHAGHDHGHDHHH